MFCHMMGRKITDVIRRRLPPSFMRWLVGLSKSSVPISRCKCIETATHQQNWEPLGLHDCAERTVELDGGSIPVENLPAHGVTVLLARNHSHAPKQCLA